MPGYLRTQWRISPKTLDAAADGLQLKGPLIDVHIYPPSRPGEAVKGFALIDTGASMCMIQKSAVERLRLRPHGTMRITSATHRRVERGVYTVGLEIGDHRTCRDPIEAAELANPGLPFDFIIGRNVLKTMVLTYVGFGGIVALAE